MQCSLPRHSLDTVAIVEKALEDNETLEKVIVVELPPRADSKKLAELTKHSNSTLKGRVDKSKFKNQITIATLKALYNHPDKDIFGSSTATWSDGIHLRGRLGSELYTESILTALRTAGLTQSRSQTEVSTTPSRTTPTLSN